MVLNDEKRERRRWIRSTSGHPLSGAQGRKAGCGMARVPDQENEAVFLHLAYIISSGISLKPIK
jgi:hypothetical protein